MRRAVRVGLVVLGAALAVYGAASLTGGWLGTPPWWERTAAGEYEWVFGMGPRFADPPEPPPYTATVAVRGREWISGGGVAAGLALVAVGAWPRRRRVATP